MRTWHEASRPYRSPAGPDPTFEWLLWTTLVGAWPIDADRMAGFATKAMREAKVHTTWTDPDVAYEAAVHRFLAGVLADDTLVASIDHFVDGVRRPGRAAALVQVALAATAVGSPDLYHGDEVWNLSLVDPDNRRPVDHDRLVRLLDQVEAGVDPAQLWRAGADDPDDQGLTKLALWQRLLSVRARQPDAFTGAYRPLLPDGPGAGTLLAFTAATP